MGIAVCIFILKSHVPLYRLILSHTSHLLHHFTHLTRFMIGKCYEKIANTVDQETYSQVDNISKRHYERLMMKALER